MVYCCAPCKCSVRDFCSNSPFPVGKLIGDAAPRFQNRLGVRLSCDWHDTYRAIPKVPDVIHTEIFNDARVSRENSAIRINNTRHETRVSRVFMNKLSPYSSLSGWASNQKLPGCQRGPIGRINFSWQSKFQVIITLTYRETLYHVAQALRTSDSRLLKNRDHPECIAGKPSVRRE